MAGNNNTNVRCTPGQIIVKEVTIANGEAVSDAINMNAMTLVGVKFPATMTSSTVTLQDSFDGITFFDTYNIGDLALQWGFTQGRYYHLEPVDTSGFINLKIKVDSSEGAERTIQVVLRGVA